MSLTSVLLLAVPLALLPPEPASPPDGAPAPTWTALDTGYAGALYGMHAVDRAELWAVGWGAPASAAAILRSLDGGATWQELADLGAVAIFADLHFAGPQAGALVGIELLASSDGGVTWTDAQPLMGVMQALAVRGRELWAVGGESLIFHSVDAGASWSALPAPVEPGGGHPLLLSAVAVGPRLLAGDGDGRVWVLGPPRGP